MSLLLDALKKAAEQKAEKSRQADAKRQASEQVGGFADAAPAPEATIQQTRADDTALDNLKPDQTQGRQVAGEDDAAREDTELTAAELDQTGSEQGSTIDGNAADDTELTSGVYDQTQSKGAGLEKQTREDDTDTQLPESTDTQFDPFEIEQSAEADTRGWQPGSHKGGIGDDTELTGIIAAETKDLPIGGRKEADAEAEDTDLSGVVPAESGGLQIGSKNQAAAEDTDISAMDIANAFDEDESKLLTDDDVSQFMGDGISQIERSKSPEQPGKPAHEEELSAKSAGEDDTIIIPGSQLRETTGDDRPTAGEDNSVSLFDGDYSDRLAETDQSELRLVDQTSTNYTGGDFSISLFDEDVTPLAPEVTKSDDSSEGDITDPGLSLADKTGLRSLKLIDISDSSLQDIELTRSENTTPSLNTTDLDSPEKMVTRQDSTSTHTFAADNYDRTLQRPSAGDQANVFTGMKSESGDILTAEHAKKVFHSKASSLRMTNFKIYGGMVIVILVIVVGLGINQLEQDTENIEARLRPLKRDPMPGLIKNATDQGFTDIFASSSGAEVDARALELVENAEMIAGAEEVVIDLGAEETSMDETAVTIAASESPQAQSESAASDEAQQLVVATNETVVEKIISNIGNDQSKDQSPGIIQITSKSSITEKDRLLQEAYAAYQQGKDDLAMVKYNQVLDLDPGNRNALLARAAINIQNNNIEAAIQDYKTLLIANPKDSLAMSSMTAVANYSPGQSESLLKLLIRDEPNSPYLNFALGNVYVAQNRWSEAQGQYFTAFQNNPDDPNYAYNLAVSLEHINQPRVAISYYQRALDNFGNGLATFNRDVVDQRLEMLGQL